MIVIDKSKCVRCGACIQDCVVNVLVRGEDGYPAFRNAPCMVVASTPKMRPVVKLIHGSPSATSTYWQRRTVSARAGAASPFVPSRACAVFARR